jgi:hypothetical protein
VGPKVTDEGCPQEDHRPRKPWHKRAWQATAAILATLVLLGEAGKVIATLWTWASQFGT